MRFPAYPAYKNSGVEWLGEVPEHWEVWKLSHGFVNTGSGTTPPSDNDSWYDGDIPWITTAELRENTIEETSKKVSAEAVASISALKVFPKGSLVIAMYGATIGRLGILGVPATTNQACCVMYGERALSIKFMFYWLQCFRDQIIFLASGGGQPNISQEKVRSLRIACPLLSEQGKIANFLDAQTAKIDALLARKRELIDKLKEKRTALISRTVTRGLPPEAARAARLDPQPSMKDSGVEWLGDVPEHWEVKKLSYLSLLKSGENIISEQLDDEGEYPVYGGNGRRGFFSRFTHQGDFVLIGRQGALCGNINYASGKFWASEHAIVVNPLTEFVTRWLGEVLRAMNLNQYSVSAAQPGLSVSTIAALKIPVPSIHEQFAIADFLDRETVKIDRMVAKAEEAMERLKEYRSALITAAVTGKIDVREAAS